MDTGSIKKAISITDLASRYTNLKNINGYLKGTCPFHDNDSDPSLFIYEDEGRFHCFGCGKSGDIFDFIRFANGCSFIEAKKYLINEYKLNASERFSQISDNEILQTKFLRALAEANEYFVENINNASFPALSYLAGRGLSLGAIEKFKIGYCHQGFEFMNEIRRKNDLSNKQMYELGLFRYSPDEKRPISRYDGMIMIPICTRSGKIIGFGARDISGGPAKYVNSPSNILFSKKETLFGLNHAHRQIVKKGEVLIVEGFMDAISLSQAGMENVLACMGTSLTVEHLQSLAPIAKTFNYLFDGDPAGREAGLSAVDKALLLGLKCAIIELPFGTDPDSFVQKNGVSLLADHIASAAMDGMKYSYLTRLRHRGLMDVLGWMKGLLAKAPSPLFRALLIRQIEETCGLPVQSILSEFNYTETEESVA